MSETLEGMEYIGASINSSIGNNLCFADDIDLIADNLVIYSIYSIRSKMSALAMVLRLVK